MVNCKDANPHEELLPIGGGGRSEPDSMESAKATRGSTVSKLEGMEFDALMENGQGFENRAGWADKGAMRKHPAHRGKGKNLKKFFVFASLASLTILLAIATSPRYRQLIGIESIEADVMPAMYMAVDAESLERYEDDLDAAIEEFSRRWEGASKNSRYIFRSECFPPPNHSKEAFVTDPPTTIRALVSDLRLIERPAEADEDEIKRRYALQLRLYTAVCRAAVSRLISYDEKRSFVSKHPTCEVTLDTLHTYWSKRESNPPALTEQASFEEFDEMLGSRRMEWGEIRIAGEGKTAPRIFVEKLATMVILREIENRDDRRVHAAFSSFIDALGGPQVHSDEAAEYSANNFPLQPSETIFVASFFKDAFNQFERLMLMRRRVEVPVESWAENWDGELLLQCMDTLVQQHSEWSERKKRLRQAFTDAWREMLKEDSDPMDMVWIALHLL